MTLLINEEIARLEYRLSRELNEQKRNEINELYKQYKVFVNTEAMNRLILPKLKRYICKRFEI
jgi:hypothetical protein